MNKRGNSVWENVTFLILLAIAIIPLAFFISSQNNGAAYLEDFYSKEITNIINNAEAGMEFKIDITPLANSAFENQKDVLQTVYIDNVKNKVIISARKGASTEFNFLNDLDIVDFRVENPSGNPEATRFIFKTVEKQRNE